MTTSEKKGITVKIDAALHAEIRAYLESHEMTMADFITMATDHELHDKFTIQGREKNMENMRTLAFQVPESLFNRIKAYLDRNHMTQKEFVLGLIEEELERDERLLQSNENDEGCEAEEGDEEVIEEDESNVEDSPAEDEGEAEEEEGNEFGQTM